MLCACSRSTALIPEHRIIGRPVPLPDDAALNYSSLYLNETEQCIVKTEFLGDIVLKKIYYEADSVANVFRRGRGPNEYPFLWLQQIDGQGNLYAKSQTGGQLLKFSPACELLETLPISPDAIKSVAVGDRFVSYGGERTMYRLWSADGKQNIEFGNFPDDGVSCENRYKTYAYQGKLLANERLGRFAFLCSYADILDIYEIGDEGAPTKVFSKREHFPSYTPQKDVIGVRYRDLVIRYSDAYATDRSIYALYSGKPTNGGRTEAGIRNAQESDRIEVYDWDGAHRCDLLLDRPILDFCVGSDDGFLIALYSDEGEMRFCRYDLAGIGIR